MLRSLIRSRRVRGPKRSGSNEWTTRRYQSHEYLLGQLSMPIFQNRGQWDISVSKYTRQQRRVSWVRTNTHRNNLMKVEQ